MKKGDVVYISGPYTKGNVNENVRHACKVGEDVKRFGLLPFVPHLYHVWDLASPHNYEYWMELCMAWVPKCQAVFRLPGESSGAEEEVRLAQSLNIPVVTSLGELVNLIDLAKDRVA